MSRASVYPGLGWIFGSSAPTPAEDEGQLVTYPTEVISYPNLDSPLKTTAYERYMAQTGEQIRDMQESRRLYDIQRMPQRQRAMAKLAKRGVISPTGKISPLRKTQANMSITEAQLAAGMTPAQAQAALGGQPMLRVPIAPSAPGASKRGRKSTSKAVVAVGGANRKPHVGKRGGTYVWCRGRKLYLKPGATAYCAPRKYKKRKTSTTAVRKYKKRSTAVRKYKKRSGGRKRKYACSAGRKLKGGRKMHKGKNGGQFYYCRGNKVYVSRARKVGGRRRTYKKRRTVKRKASWGKPCKSRYGRKLHTGEKGGKYYMCKNRRVYVKQGRKRSYKKRTGGRKRKASYGKPCSKRYGRKLHTGPNGGKFYMCKKRRVYVKK